MSAQRCKGAIFAIVCLLIPLSALIPVLDIHPTQAATSSTLTFQARLLGASGNLVADGTYNMQFNLYDVSSGGTTLWTESRLNSATQGVTLKSGYFSVDLGSITSFPSTINWDQELWLGMTVRGTGSCVFGSCTPTDGEMTPRFKLTAVPYATSAGQLQKTNGANSLKVTTTTPTANITYTFQDAAAGTYNICTSANNCTGLGAYIQNGTTLQSTANFNIRSAATGSITANFQAIASQTAEIIRVRDSTDTTTVFSVTPAGNITSAGTYNGNTFSSSTLTFSAAGATSISSAATQSLTVDSGTTGALNLGTGASAKTVTLGSVTGASITNIQAGTGTAAGDLNISTTAGGIINIGNNAVINKVLNLGSTGSTNAASTVNIASTNANQTQAVTIGNTTSANNVVLVQGGTSATAIRLSAGAGGTIAVGSVNNNNITINAAAVAGTTIIGGTTTTGTLTVGRSTASNTISIGAAAGNLATQTIGIGNSATAGSTTNITIGSTIAGTTTLQGNVTLSGGTNNGVYFRNGSGNFATIAAGTTGQCLIATTGSAPSWGTCAGSGSGVTLQAAYDNGNTITTTSARDISYALANTATDSNFNVNIATGSGSQFAVQNNGTNFFTAGGILTGNPMVEITSNGTHALHVRNAANGTVFQVDVSGGSVNVAPGNNLVVDTNTLYVDATANRVGIGITPSVANSNLEIGNTGGNTAVEFRPNAGGLTTLTFNSQVGSNLVIESDDTNETLRATANGTDLVLNFAGATLNRDLTVDTNTLFVDSTNNQVGIGTTSFGAGKLYVSGATGGSFSSLAVFSATTTATTGTDGVYSELYVSPGSASTASYYALDGLASSASANLTGNADLAGVSGLGQNTGTGTINYVGGAFFRTNNTSTGTITNAYGAWIGTNTNTGGGTIINNYGLRIDDRGVGTNRTNLGIGTTTTGNWSIYNNSAYNNYFQGNLRIGTSGTPNAPLDIVAAAATSIRVTAGASWPLILQQDTSSNFTINNNNTTTLTILGASGNVVLGAVDVNGALLVLDTKNTAGDPTGVAGGMYYNSNSSTFRCFTSSWIDCAGGSSKWTDAGAYTYLTASTDRLIVGSTSDVSTTKLAVISTNSANNVSTFNTQASLTTTTASTRTFNTWLNTDIAPGSAVGTNTNYSVLHLWTGVNSAGRLDTTTDIRKIDLYTEYNSTVADTIGSATNIYTSDVVNTNFTISNFRGVQLNDPGGAGTITANTALNVANQTKGTNNTNVLIGTTTIPSGNYSIYNSSNYTNLFQGSVIANNSATGTTRTTEAVARTNVTTVTTTVAGFTNNDIIFINNAGQDYYTRITAGGGTTTLTVSPAVSYDASATVTLYQNIANIGATTTDYTTQTNRFFQGYFLGGVVTGAGSTTLSDGALNSTGNLTLQSTSGNVGIGTGSTTPATKLEVSGTGTNVGITVDAPSGFYAMQYFAENGVNKWHYEVAPTSFGGYFSFVESGVAERLRVATGGAIRVPNATSNATQTNYTQALTQPGTFNFETTYVNGNYTPGIIWSTSNDNATRPKAGIYTQLANTGSRILFGTSNSYATGITNEALLINESGEVEFTPGASTNQSIYVSNYGHAATTFVGLGVNSTRTAGNYGLLMSSSSTYLNAPSGGTVYLRVANGDIFSASSSGLTLSTGQLYGPGSASTYGALSVNGTKNSWGGINFRSGGSNLGTLMVDATNQGFYNDTDNGWDWYWANGTLSAGSVPYARLTGVGSLATQARESTSGVTIANGGAGGQIGPEILGQGGGAAALTFHRPGAFAAHLGIDTDSVFKVGGWSYGNASYRLVLGDGYVNSGVITASTNIFAQQWLIAGAMNLAINNTTICWGNLGTLSSCTSSRTQKHNIVDIGYGIEELRQLRPVNFDWNADNRADIGFVAEEVAEIIPQSVQLNPDGSVKSFSYDSIVPLLTKSVQQLDVQVQDIDTRLAVLESGEFAGNLTVAGYTELNGNLTVQGDTTVQKLTVNGKIITGGSAPTVAVGIVSGVAATVNVEGNDTAGKVSYITGTVSLPANSVAAGAQVTATFNEAYSQAPRIALTPKNQKAASVRYFVETTTTGFTLHFIDAPDPSTQYDYDYIVIQ